jgi:hypothetical protein
MEAALQCYIHIDCTNLARLRVRNGSILQSKQLLVSVLPWDACMLCVCPYSLASALHPRHCCDISFPVVYIEALQQPGQNPVTQHTRRHRHRHSQLPACCHQVPCDSDSHSSWDLYNHRDRDLHATHPDVLTCPTSNASRDGFLQPSWDSTLVL